MAVTVIGHVVATSFLLDAGRPGRDSAKLSPTAAVQRASVDVYCQESSPNRHVTTSACLVVCWHSKHTKKNLGSALGFCFKKNGKVGNVPEKRQKKSKREQEVLGPSHLTHLTGRSLPRIDDCFRFAPPGPPSPGSSRLLPAPGPDHFIPKLRPLEPRPPLASHKSTLFHTSLGP
jgi:hypothetical protein